ncbi:YbhB/YbcL family Raf kinase inhibitor-like protein [Kiritimatiella glycovorans]|uniref:Putative kinase inhibitor n=1 Tax=Kiritimatiella glycovorans TaxID=1307763 RepID=A0A0G3EF78_9BACT|nr:YbhB/YbcL family Raf kinase inhibitor-like protein [Kiritimatiella glycovorans]AKJ63430.1 putative kinase inhibitor [Kiritimatiella glycovorans]
MVIRSHTIPVFLFLAVSFAMAVQAAPNRKKEGESPMQLSSSAFESGEMIPSQYTCDGADVSIPLSWTNAPEGVRSFALIVDDPDAPVGTWVHWVMYNIPADVRALPENIPADPQTENGAVQGLNDFRRIGYGGPCPPDGTHRYFFRLFALDTELGLEPGASRDELLEAIEGHVIAKAELMGRYKRQ